MTLQHSFLLFFLLVSCGEAESQGDFLEGPAAQAAFDQWYEGLAFDWDYPLGFRMETFAELGSEDSQYTHDSGRLVLDSNVSMQTPWDFAMQVDVILLDSKLGRVSFSVSFSCDDSDLRASIDDVEVVEFLAEMDVASGYKLSTDRARQGFDLIKELAFVLFEQPQSNEYAAAIRERLSLSEVQRMTGFADFFHPRITLAGVQSLGIQIKRWEVIDGVVTMDMDLHSVEGMGISELAVSMNLSEESVREEFEDLVFRASFDEANGFPKSMDFIFATLDDCDEHGSHPIKLALGLRYLPLQTTVSTVEFPDPEDIMDLNVQFDEYWPLVEAFKPELLEQMRSGADAQNAEEDFSF